MSIQELQTSRLDINNNYEIDVTLKQLDDIVLKIVVYDKSLPADLSNYTARLKAFKSDQVPLIQNTQIYINNNEVTIKGDPQLGTTSGIVKSELQFINKTTFEKKSSFYININVVASVLETDRGISVATCTLLKEIDNKLDQIENIGNILEDAIEVNSELKDTTIPAANTANDNLESSIYDANASKLALDQSKINADNSKIALDESVDDANDSKSALDLSKFNADNSKAALDESIEEANNFVNNHGDIINLDNRVTELAAQTSDSVQKIKGLNKKDLISYENNCVITIIDDDAQSTFMSKLKPILDAKGIKASIAVIGRDAGVNGEMTVETLKSLETQGHDVLSHSWANELHTFTTDADLDNELSLAQNFMYENDFKGKDCIVYPTGFSNNSTGIWVKQHVRKYFKYGINAWESVKQPIDNLYIGRVDFNNLTLEQLTTKLNEYIARNDWMILMVHSWQETFNADKLSSFINLATTNNVKILPFTEAVKLKGNIISSGEYTTGGFTLDSSGRMSANYTIANMNTVMSKVPKNYPNNAVYYEILQNWVNGMPVVSGMSNISWAKYGGILITFRGLDDNYTKQMFIQTGLLGTIFTRYWSVASSQWGAWKCVSDLTHTGSFNGTDFESLPLTAFNKNSVTVTQIYNNTWTLLSGAGGTLTTYRSQDDAYGYQDFVPYNQAKRYKRSWNSSTLVWNAFEAYS